MKEVIAWNRIDFWDAIRALRAWVVEGSLPTGEDVYSWAGGLANLWPTHPVYRSVVARVSAQGNWADCKAVHDMAHDEHTRRVMRRRMFDLARQPHELVETRLAYKDMREIRLSVLLRELEKFPHETHMGHVGTWTRSAGKALADGAVNVYRHCTARVIAICPLYGFVLASHDMGTAALVADGAAGILALHVHYDPRYPTFANADARDWADLLDDLPSLSMHGCPVDVDPLQAFIVDRIRSAPFAPEMSERHRFDGADARARFVREYERLSDDEIIGLNVTHETHRFMFPKGSAIRERFARAEVTEYMRQTPGDIAEMRHLELMLDSVFRDVSLSYGVRYDAARHFLAHRREPQVDYGYLHSLAHITELFPGTPEALTAAQLRATWPTLPDRPREVMHKAAVRVAEQGDAAVAQFVDGLSRRVLSDDEAHGLWDAGADKHVTAFIGLAVGQLRTRQPAMHVT